MKVIIISDSVKGGAAIATNRLLDGLYLNLPNVERYHFSQARTPPPPFKECSLDQNKKRPPFERFIKNISRRFAHKLRHHRHEAALFNLIESTQPDIINVHNLHASGIDHRTLLKLPKNIPIVWTLHDCWAFDEKAFYWRNQALQIEEEISPSPDPSFTNPARRQFFENAKFLSCVAPSHWIAAEATKQIPPGTPIHVIPYGVPTDSFSPIDKLEARQTLQLPPKRIWLGHCATWANTRKGLDILHNALTHLDCSNFGLLLWGEKDQFVWPASLTVRRLGPVNEISLQQALYSACDFFICPSRIDNLPNAVLESLSCGTGIIGHAVGGIPDMVIHNKTGFLFKDEATGLLNVLQSIISIDKAQLLDISATAAATARTQFSIRRQADHYTALFRELYTRIRKS